MIDPMISPRPVPVSAAVGAAAAPVSSPGGLFREGPAIGAPATPGPANGRHATGQAPAVEAPNGHGDFNGGGPIGGGTNGHANGNGSADGTYAGLSPADLLDASAPAEDGPAWRTRRSWSSTSTPR